MLVTAICEGFPTLPHKGGFSLEAACSQALSRGRDHPFPLAVPLSVKQYNATTPALPPAPILFTQPAPPCSHHPQSGHREWGHVFLNGECGLLVNSWAAILSGGKSSQVAARWLCLSTPQQTAKDMNTEQFLKKDLHEITECLQNTTLIKFDLGDKKQKCISSF